MVELLQGQPADASGSCLHRRHDEHLWRLASGVSAGVALFRCMAEAEDVRLDPQRRQHLQVQVRGDQITAFLRQGSPLRVVGNPQTLR